MNKTEKYQEVYNWSISGSGSVHKDSILGFICGITTGIAYGLNPLFAMPLIDAGAPVDWQFSLP